MRKVIGIGETVLDIILKDGQPVSAVPGGSVFNALVSLGRCGVPATMVTETGRDRVGDDLIQFMHTNGMDTSCVVRYAQGQSAVSLAYLDEHNEAQYLFYKSQATEHQDFSYPDISADDIVVLGSYFALDPAVRSQVVGLLDRARDRGAIIYYDINFRPSHRSDIMKITPNLLDNLDYADIVRGSRDDFATLYRKTDVKAVYRSEISFYCRRLIYTQGADPTVVMADGDYYAEYPVADVQTVSTIGAGDNFNAGFVYGLLHYGITRQQLTQGLSAAQWDGLMDYARQFAAACCKSIYNYVPADFGRVLKG